MSQPVCGVSDEVGALISLFDARDGGEITRLADILGETIQWLDPELAKAAPTLPALRRVAAGYAPPNRKPKRSKRRPRNGVEGASRAPRQL
jgi:hypothetical protein